MAKNKLSKPQTNPPKRNNKSSSTSAIHQEDTMDIKAKKRKKIEVEVSKQHNRHFNFPFMYEIKRNI